MKVQPVEKVIDPVDCDKKQTVIRWRKTFNKMKNCCNDEDWIDPKCWDLKVTMIMWSNVGKKNHYSLSILARESIGEYDDKKRQCKIKKKEELKNVYIIVNMNTVLQKEIINLKTKIFFECTWTWKIILKSRLEKNLHRKKKKNPNKKQKEVKWNAW